MIQVIDTRADLRRAQVRRDVDGWGVVLVVDGAPAVRASEELELVQWLERTGRQGPEVTE